MKHYRRVYIEIVGKCNLKCSFCVNSNIKRDLMTYETFTNIIDQIKDITDVVYYHVLGEPLLHPDLEKMMLYAKESGLKNAITTNGTLLKNKLGKWHDLNICRINLSLHAYLDQNNHLEDKIDEIIETSIKIREEAGGVLFFRLWDIENPKDKEIANKILNKYNKEINDDIYKPNGYQIADYLRLQVEKQFTWPINATEGIKEGFCKGLRTHFAILSDGKVVPCCLDADGQITLGNIHNEKIIDILNSPLANDIYQGFTEHHAIHQICQKCEYKSRFHQ